MEGFLFGLCLRKSDGPENEHIDWNHFLGSGSVVGVNSPSRSYNKYLGALKIYIYIPASVNACILSKIS